MTIAEVLANVDEIKPNQYDDSLKIKWISQLEGRIINDVILTHERNEDEEEITDFGGYDDWAQEVELVVPDEYAELYSLYIMAKIDFANQETDRYQNSSLMFNAAYSDYTAWYNRTHKSIKRKLRLF